MQSTISPRQQQLIEAASKILATKGINGLTTKALAHEMGFSEGAIYRHFANKEAIILTLLDYLHKQLERIIVETPPSGQSEADFRQFFSSLFGFFHQHPNFVTVVFSDGLLEESEAIKAAMLRVMFSIIGYLQPLIMAGQQQGIFTSAVQADALVHIIMGSMRLQMLKWRLLNLQFDIRAEGQTLLNNLLILIQQK